MCGIAGIVYLNNNQGPLTRELYKMSQAILHRGPDSEGYLLASTHTIDLAGGIKTPSEILQSSFPYTPDSANITQLFSTEYRLGFAHRRLSIIDTSPAGHQPMSYDAERYWITYNGELYNYLELKLELILLGVSFNTNTDTEVILAAYRQWGRDCLGHFNGMFAFVIFDAADNLLFGARDRFGVKPFYYTFNEGRFCFASEQKGLLELDNFQRKINEQAVFEYLVLAKTEIHAQGLFIDILELLPAQCFTLFLGAGKLNIEKYYNLSYNHDWQPFDKKHFENYSATVKEKLFDAVSLRLRSDAPLGSCLSGGIDSSALVSITDAITSKKYHSQIGTRQQVFTAAYPNDAVDESKWAKMVVDTTNTSWHQVYPHPEDFIKQLEELTLAQDIPILASSTYAQYCVMRMVKEQQVKVTLDGQGADELFAGYPGHFSSFLLQAAKQMSYSDITNSFGNTHASFSDPKQLFWSTMKNMGAGLMQPFFKSFAFKNLHKEYSYLQPDFWQRQKDGLDLLHPGKVIPLNQLLHQQFTGADLKVLLRTGDRNSMHFSVESRVPFADDHPLIEYVFSIAPAFKIRHAQSKSLLREAMKGTMPEQVRLRKDKLGFATPQHHWLTRAKKELKGYIQQDLDQYIDSKKLLRDWDKIFDTIPPHATNRLYRIIQFSVWKKVFKI